MEHETARGLAGKRALVTAAGAGIGKACAERLVAEGAEVVALDIDERALQSISGATQKVAIDVTDKVALARFVDEEPAFDILVSAAGTVHHGTILDCTDEDWERSLDLNLTAMFQLVRACLPAMIAAGGGSIITIASVASSVTGVPERCAYGASKAGVIGLTKSIAADFVGQGIRANVVCPGTVDSPSLAQRMAATGDAEKARAAFEARQPMGRLGRPQEIAALVALLASDEAGFTTGAVHVVDGGWTM